MAQKSTKKRSWFQKILLWALIGSVASGILIWVVLRRADAGAFVFAACFLVFVIFMAETWLCVVFHELGHVLAGLVVGYKFQSVQVGARTLATGHSGFKLGISSDPERDGLTQMSPPDEKPTIGKYRFYIAGGPGANLICGLAFLIVFLSYWPPPDAPYAEQCLHFFYGSVIFISMVMVFVNLMPQVIKGIPSDGLQLWTLRRRDDATIRKLATQFLSGRIRVGELARTWPTPWMDALKGPLDGSAEEVAGHYLRFYWFTDIGNNDLAWAELTRASILCAQLKEKAGIFPGLVHSAQIFMAAWLFRDLGRLQGLPPMQPPADEMGKSDYLRAMAAVAFLDHRPQDCLALIMEERLALQELCTRMNSRSSNDLAWLDEMEEAASALAKAQPKADE